MIRPYIMSRSSPLSIPIPNGFSITKSIFVRSQRTPFCISMLQKYSTCSPISKSFFILERSSTRQVGKQMSCRYWYFSGWRNMGTHIFSTSRVLRVLEAKDFWRQRERYFWVGSEMERNSRAGKNTMTMPLCSWAGKKQKLVLSVAQYSTLEWMVQRKHWLCDLSCTDLVLKGRVRVRFMERSLMRFTLVRSDTSIMSSWFLDRVLFRSDMFSPSVSLSLTAASLSRPIDMIMARMSLSRSFHFVASFRIMKSSDCTNLRMISIRKQSQQMSSGFLLLEEFSNISFFSLSIAFMVMRRPTGCLLGMQFTFLSLRLKMKRTSETFEYICLIPVKQLCARFFWRVCSSSSIAQWFVGCRKLYMISQEFSYFHKNSTNLSISISICDKSQNPMYSTRNALQSSISRSSPTTISPITSSSIVALTKYTYSLFSIFFISSASRNCISANLKIDFLQILTTSEDTSSSGSERLVNSMGFFSCFSGSQGNTPAIASFTFPSMYISSAWSLSVSCRAPSSNSAFTFRTTSSLSMVSNFESISLEISGSMGFLSRMIEFLSGEVSLSTNIFSLEPGISIVLLRFFMLSNSITIFSPSLFLPSEVCRTRKVLREDDFLGGGESIFLRTMFEMGCFGELFRCYFYSFISMGLFKAFKSQTLRLRMLCLYSSDKVSSFDMMSLRCSSWGMKICLRSSSSSVFSCCFSLARRHLRRKGSFLGANSQKLERKEACRNPRSDKIFKKQLSSQQQYSTLSFFLRWSWVSEQMYSFHFVTSSITYRVSLVRWLKESEKNYSLVFPSFPCLLSSTPILILYPWILYFSCSCFRRSLQRRSLAMCRNQYTSSTDSQARDRRS